MTDRLRRTILGPLLVAVLALAACGGGDPPPQPPPSPLADCAGLAAAEPAAASAPLPAVTLPCFTGGEPVALDRLRGPAVVNLWASWCGPCREELPVLQRYADQAGDRVRVVGVVTRDRASAAAALAEHLEISFPALDDRDGTVLNEVGRMSLPVTLFVDASGGVTYVHHAPLTDAELGRLSQERLGVMVG